MGAVIIGLALGWLLVLALWRSAKKAAARPPKPAETKEEKKKREREEQRQRRLSDMAKFLADPRLLK